METQIFIPFRPNPNLSPHDSREMSDPKEKFFRYFQAEITAIQGQIDDLATISHVGGERQDCIDTVLAGISRLSNEVMDAGDYVPAYDQRAYSQAMKALTEKLNDATASFTPKSRFQFKSKSSKQAPSAETQVDPRQRTSFSNVGSKQSPVLDAAKRDAINAANNATTSSKDYNEDVEQQSGVRKPSFSNAKSISIYDHTGLHIMLPSTASRATSSGSLTNLERCVVDMTVPTSKGAPFAGLALKNIKQSLIIAGHVSGPVHITGLQNSIVVVAARQVRIHECKDVDIYLHCASHPIIEDCSEMRFAPLPEFYASKLEVTGENQWDQVDDFKWLKSEPSPNWGTLPEDKRIPADVWENSVCGSPSLSTDDILRKAGILGARAS
ncbi:TBCC-domain-containing protein [Annulohypoxylon maeteangense]|uniref:TBCC-domain-containing protein n=1 Tax=Annulohypoxylon maeteangense TaxID=1927788 RepID=UPI002008B847|nr:TBCC-domain-containing protein [Annulohypoxylon maeteangense]KAI0886994.1 TBCC-domain-containing protein [Annulohypoxylon maeteangense]